jgi:hypothetical protein
MYGKGLSEAFGSFTQRLAPTLAVARGPEAIYMFDAITEKAVLANER